jgi:uncharacterized protein (TIRG00374 family)
MAGVLGALLWWSLRNVPFPEIGATLRLLRWWQLAALLGLNAAAIGLITARWWLIVRASNPGVPFLPLVLYRLAVFGFSYFTPGPQVGGEPLQVVYLHRNHGITSTRATATVILDKLIEFLVNFLLLAVGLWAVLSVGLLSDLEGVSAWGVAGLGTLLLWPPVHLMLLYRGVLPVTRLIARIPGLNMRSRAVRIAVLSERMAANFSQRSTRALLGAVAVSALAVAVIITEYGLMAHYLGVDLTALEMFAAVTMLQLAFLVPLPGGLGAMEASQVFAFGVFGASAAAAISMVLLQRARDVLNGGIGLLATSRGFGKKSGAREKTKPETWYSES